MFTDDVCLYAETFVFKVVNDTGSLSEANRWRITTGLEYYFGAFGDNVTLNEVINEARTHNSHIQFSLLTRTNHRAEPAEDAGTGVSRCSCGEAHAGRGIRCPHVGPFDCTGCCRQGHTSGRSRCFVSH